MKLDAPVFIGGTGRSGTSIAASLIASHPDFCLPCHENKLIVERAGLIDIVNQLSGRYDILRNHFAVQAFVTRAQKLRQHGFNDVQLNSEVQRLMTQEHMGAHAAMEQVQRSNPHIHGSIHAIAAGFGADHYWQCISRFVIGIASYASERGIMDTDGLLQPFFITKQLTREAILSECRSFLDQLYGPSMVSSHAARWIDDTPANFLYADFLHELYPNMKLVHMMRDPRDVVASYLDQVWTPSDPQQVAQLCAGMIDSYCELRSKLPPESVLEVRLEDLVEHTDETLTKLADFLGVEPGFNASLISQNAAHIGRSTALQPLILSLVENRLGDWMRQHAYLPMLDADGGTA
jgi:Sulfotransferase family